ncbi:MAG: TonB-dependent receptor [Fidelibacterota bacterium]|nr:MAG: TonB-dependent receptor [Candidatus Neomarinimicrobiota bacterium]
MSLLDAGVGGKLSGRILSQDQQPMIGANVVLDGTTLGAATNTNGEYFILNIPPGRYTVRISVIGYRTHVQEDVLIVSDLTTELDVELMQTTLEAEEVVVVAERPLFRKDATSNVTVVTADEIVNMPIGDIQDILAIQAGFTTDAEGELHVRGGRSREILYIIDGMVVKDPLTGGFSGLVSQNAIQELTVISGTFNAEYGEAMSSVVNVVTREGSDNFQGKIEYISNFLEPSPYHQSGAFEGVLDTNYTYSDLKEPLFRFYQESPAEAYPQPLIPLMEMPMSGTGSITMSGALPVPRTTFFLSAMYGSRDSHLPHGVSVGQDVQFKLTTKPTHKLKFSGLLKSSSQILQGYSHPWKYLPENQAHTFRSTDRLSLTLTHTLSTRLFHTLSLWKLNVGARTGVQDLTTSDYERPLTDETVYFYTSGTSGTYTNNTTSTVGGKWDLTYQLQQHQLKTGFTFKSHTLNLNTTEEPWDGGINLHDSTTFTPKEGAFYIQDKIELDYIILNLGLRYDHLDPKAAMWENIYRFGYRDSVSGEWTPAPLMAVPAQSQWSPRMGIAYPVTDLMVFHFSYGHFFQFPSFDAITYNAGKDISATLPLVGNPRVRAQKTVAFETGLKYALSDRLAFSLTAWSKDITNLLSTIQVRYLSRQYVVYANSDYASVKGIDFALRLRRTGYIGGSLGYSLSVAKGNNSTPMGGYFSAYTQEEIPHQEYYLDFDQRHDFSLNLDLVTPTDLRTFAGLLSNITANLLIEAGSGLPYTPYVDPTVRIPINSGRKPWTFSADLRIRKAVYLGGVKLDGLLEITNLTDYQNVMYVYARTGKPFDPGFSGVGTSEDANHNPARIGPPRMIKVGFDVIW